VLFFAAGALQPLVASVRDGAQWRDGESGFTLLLLAISFVLHYLSRRIVHELED
jgi:hypothetical protein